MSLLVDTNILFAYANTRESRREAAVDLFAEMVEGKHGRICTTTFIVDETLTLLGARGQSHEAARRILGIMGLAPDTGLPHLIEVLDVTLDDVRATLALQERHWDRGLSFTDCTSLHVMARDGIDALATLDAGFEGLVPVVP